MSRDVILVTGGGGYLGSALVPRLLATGYRVRVIDRFYFGRMALAPSLDHKNLEVFEADIIDQENIASLFQDVKSVVHLASLSNDPSCDLDPNLSIRTNFLGTIALARRAKQEGVERFIFASSCSVYGAQTDLFLTEDSPTAPVTLYALSKLESERELTKLADENFAVVLPRMATLFGLAPRMRFDLAINVMIKRCILKEGLVVNGDGLQYRPFLHVVDAAEIFITFLTMDTRFLNAQVVNLGCESNNFMIHELAEKIAAEFPDASIRRVIENNDIRSYKVSFARLREVLSITPQRRLMDAIDEIKAAHENGSLVDMNAKNHYNLLVMKETMSRDFRPPNMAGPTLANSSRWSPVNTEAAAQVRDGVRAQAIAASRPKITAVILAYNCERMLKRAHSRIPKDLVDEIIVADDCSKDRTAEVARELGLTCFSNKINRGYGGNLKEAMRLAFSRGADYVVEIHGDGAQFDPISIKYALPRIAEGYDLILGSRFIEPMKALKNGMPLIRFVANRFLSFFDRIVLRLPLTEFHTGFRIYSKNLYETVPLRLTSDDYLFSFQIIAQAAYYDLRVAEVEVEADYHSEHTSHKISGAAVYAVQTFGILFSFKLAKWKVKYSKIFSELPLKSLA